LRSRKGILSNQVRLSATEFKNLLANKIDSLIISERR
jgi:hypothetical protein